MVTSAIGIFSPFYTTYAVGVECWPHQDFFACGSMEGAFFCFGFGSFAAKTKAIKQFFHPAGGDSGLVAG
jgi:hypothetical protein